MPPRERMIIFEFLVLIKYFLFMIPILGILNLAHRKNLVQATLHIYIYKYVKNININHTQCSQVLANYSALHQTHLLVA